MWDVFKETVNEWFGDPYRREFETAVLENKVENQALGLQPDWKNDSIPQICRITNYTYCIDGYMCSTTGSIYPIQEYILEFLQ